MLASAYLYLYDILKVSMYIFSEKNFRTKVIVEENLAPRFQQ